MTPQELKSSILQLAVQGRLVEQRPEEGTAEELYRQIQEEKQRLIKEGKIKKEKPLPEIAEDEVPFDIPESWKWVRLGNISTYSQKKEKIVASDITKDMWLLDLEDIEKETGRIIQKSTIVNRKVNGDKVRFNKGQILYSKLRPYLKKVLVAPENGISTPEIVPFSMYGKINPEYIVVVLTCPHVDFAINSVTYGVKMPRVGTETMCNLLVPLPPLAEQKRIVAKIEELLPYIDRYEKAWSKLEDFNKRFPGDMQKSVLQMAIQGKLVEQRPEEGTGEELYRQIQAEKQSLIKSGKIKKEKPLPEISDDEMPFDIPESWRWVRLRDLGVTQTGNTPPKSHPEYFGQDIPFITPGDIALTNIDYNNQGISFYGENVARICNAESILQVCIGGSIGKAAITNRKVAFNQQINTITPLQCLSEYLFSVFQSAYFITTMKEKAGGTATPIINRGLWDKLLIPLPPLAEQKRIVQKLEEILPLCEKLK